MTHILSLVYLVERISVSLMSTDEDTCVAFRLDQTLLDPHFTLLEIPL